MEHRLVSLLPLSHLLEQAVGLYYALSVGADILYVRSRNPRVIFEALRDHRVTSMVVVPQVLDLFWSAIEREVEKRGRTAAFDRLRAHRPAPADAPCGAGSSGASTPSSAATSGSSCRPARSCRPPSSRPGRTSASPSSRATARPRPARARCTTLDDHGLGHRGPAAGGRRDAHRRRRRDPVPRARPCSRATGTTPRRPPRPSPPTAGTGPATSAISTTAGRLILSGRMKDIIVLPNGFNVYPGGHRERPAHRRHPRFGRRRDAGPGGSRRSCWLGSRPPARRRRPTGRAPLRARIDAGGQGRQRDASGRTSGSPAGASGRTRTSRGPTRSRSSGRRSGRGRSPTPAPMTRTRRHAGQAGTSRRDVARSDR